MEHTSIICMYAELHKSHDELQSSSLVQQQSQANSRKARAKSGNLYLKHETSQEMDEYITWINS